eukprot:408884-Rhodomonas_salina.1
MTASSNRGVSGADGHPWSVIIVASHGHAAPAPAPAARDGQAGTGRVAGRGHADTLSLPEPCQP